MFRIVLINFKSVVLLTFLLKSVLTQKCGIQKVGRGLIVGGSYSSPGAFPWFGTLKLKRNGKFFCGATLFTERHALSAAHCLKFKKQIQNLNAEDVDVSFGTYDLKDKTDPNVVVRDIQEMIIHPEWSKTSDSFHADIALLHFKSKVEFTDFIQPICLPLNNGAGILDEGTIVGYGKSENSGQSIFDHEYTPKQLNIVAISNELCFLDQPDLVRLSSKDTFCAGGKNVGACTGDSGGGFYVLSGRNYVLRGIISSSVLDGNRKCDVKSFAVYTNVSKFLEWIIENVNRTSVDSKVTVVAIEVKQWDLQALECYFSKTEISYSCDVLLLNYNDDNVKIESTNGDHIGNLTNFDVEFFRAYSKLTSYLPNGLGEIFPNLKSMYIGRCNVESIERGLFSRMKNLKKLEISWNPFGEIPHDTFWDLYNLEELFLGGNNVRMLHKNLLINLPKLKVFNCHDNRIERIDVDLFRNNLELEVVSFSNNNIQKIKGTFDLPKLKRLLLNTGCVSMDYPRTANTLEEINKKIKESCQVQSISNLEGTQLWIKRFGNSSKSDQN